MPKKCSKHTQEDHERRMTMLALSLAVAAYHMAYDNWEQFMRETEVDTIEHVEFDRLREFFKETVLEPAGQAVGVMAMLDKMGALK